MTKRGEKWEWEENKKPENTERIRQKKRKWQDGESRQLKRIVLNGCDLSGGKNGNESERRGGVSVQNIFSNKRDHALACAFTHCYGTAQSHTCTRTKQCVHVCVFEGS